MAEVDDFSVAVSMGPGMRALQPFPVKVETPPDESISEVTVAFVMKDMDMGLNRYRLIAGEAGAWRADVTLPVCVSGRSDWVADFDVLAGEQRYRLRVSFVLEK